MEREFGIYDLVGFDVSTEEKFAKMFENGFHHLGLYCYESESDDELIHRIVLAKKIGLKIEIIHGPLTNNMDLWDTACYNNNYFLNLKRFINIAGQNKIKKFVIHSCGKETPSFNDVGLRRVKELVSLCKKLGMVLLIENLRTIDHVFYLFDKIKSDNFKFCIDVGHANIWCYPPIELIKKMNKKIYSVHINDNDGGFCHDYHLIPGDGNVNWQKVIPLLYKYYDGVLMLEINNFKQTDIQYKNIDTYLQKASQQAKYLLSLIG